MIATKVVNRLAGVALDGGLVQVIVQHPVGDIRRLAELVLLKAPGAWRPAGEGGGALICEIAFHGGLTVRWHVHGVACPPGWTQLTGDRQKVAELAAGYALMECMRDELVAATIWRREAAVN